MASEETKKVPMLLQAYVVISALAFGYVAYLAFFNLAGLVGHTPSVDAQHHASYMAIRQILLALALVYMLYLKEWRILGYLLVFMGFVQLLDFALSLSDGESSQAVGQLILTILNFYSGYYLLKNVVRS
jgi:hypothetical protein